MNFISIAYSYTTFTISGSGFQNSRGTGSVSFYIRGVYYPVQIYNSWADTEIVGIVPNVGTSKVRVDAVKIINNDDEIYIYENHDCISPVPKSARIPILDQTYDTSGVTSATSPEQTVTLQTVYRLGNTYGLTGYWTSSTCEVPTSAVPYPYLTTGEVHEGDADYTWWLYNVLEHIAGVLLEYSYEFEIEEVDDGENIEELYFVD